MNKKSGNENNNLTKSEKVDLYTLLNVLRNDNKETIVKNNFYFFRKKRIKCLH
jgi:hypothetical protein